MAGEMTLETLNRDVSDQECREHASDVAQELDNHPGMTSASSGIDSLKCCVHRRCRLDSQNTFTRKHVQSSGDCEVIPVQPGECFTTEILSWESRNHWWVTS